MNLQQTVQNWIAEHSSLTDMPRYKVIMHMHRDPDTDAPLFWSNQDGWVSLQDATLFTIEEEVPLPYESWGTMELPAQPV